MSDELIKRVDALTRRPDTARARSEVPVLTDVVSEESAPRRAVDSAALEALARELERAVLERLAPEIERIIGEALAETRTELNVSVTQMVREAVAASVARALASPQNK
jgi:metal-dependent amidase/aminoacylase/carboxypeptidase family protein